MNIEVGTRVKIVKCPYGEFDGREGIVTEVLNGTAMVASKEGLPEHTCADDEFHLHFFGRYIEPIPTLTIEPGKYYRTRDGRKVGPMRFWDREWFGVDDGTRRLWNHSGERLSDGNEHDRLISEWTDTPKTWGEMTDAEKGAVAEAYVTGHPVECSVNNVNWHEGVKHPFADTFYYRIKPEPKRETVTLYGVCGEFSDKFIEGHDTHRITFDTIDGKPDLDSIKMEALG